MKQQATKLDEQKSAGASLILSFYENIQLLNNEYAIYAVMLTEHAHTTDDKEEKIDLSEEQKEEMKQANRNLMYQVNLSWISLKSISKSVKKEINQETKDIIKKIRARPIPKLTDIEEYIEKINTFLVDEIIRKLLKRASDYVRELDAKDDE